MSIYKQINDEISKLGVKIFNLSHRITRLEADERDSNAYLDSLREKKQALEVRFEKLLEVRRRMREADLTASSLLKEGEIESPRLTDEDILCSDVFTIRALTETICSDTMFDPEDIPEYLAEVQYTLDLMKDRLSPGSAAEYYKKYLELGKK